MHRWVRIYGDQYLGFWILGLLLFAVQEIPYLLMPLLRLETNPIMNNCVRSQIQLNRLGFKSALPIVPKKPVKSGFSRFGEQMAA